VTSANAVVQLVPGHAEEFCEASLYCDFNVTDVVRVQLQVNSSSGDWQTIYQFANMSWSGQLAVSFLVCGLSSCKNSHRYITNWKVSENALFDRGVMWWDAGGGGGVLDFLLVKGCIINFPTFWYSFSVKRPSLLFLRQGLHSCCSLVDSCRDHNRQ